MLSSIHPLGERARNQRWWLTVTAYIAASTAGGMSVGAIAGATGAVLPPDWRPVAAAVVGAAALVLEVARVPVLTLRRQVDEDWLSSFRGWVYGGGFGAQLGSGLATTVTTWAVYASIALAALTGSVVAGAGIGTAFGLARAAMIVLGRWIDTPGALVAFHQRLQRRARLADASVAITTMLVAVAATSAVI